MSKKTTQDLKEKLQEYEQDSCGCDSKIIRDKAFSDVSRQIDEEWDNFFVSLEDKKKKLLLN